METEQIKKQFKGKPSDLIARIMIINVFSLLLLSIFNYVAFYNTNNKAFMESVMAYNERVSEIAFDNINKQITENVADIPSRFFSDIRQNDAILYPQTAYISGSPSHIAALTSKLAEILNSCPMAKGIDIFYERTNTIVTGRGNLHFVQSDEERDRYLPWYSKFDAANATTLVMPASNDVYPHYEQVMSFIFKIQNSKWYGNDIIVAVHISPKSFSEYIDETQGQLIVESASGKILYSTSGKEISGEEIADKTKNKMSEKNAASKTVKLDELKMVVSRSDNASLGLKYYYVIPYKVFFKDYNSHLQLLIINYLISVLFTMGVLLVVSFLSNTAYRKRLISMSKKAGIEVPQEDETFDQSVNAITSQLSCLNTELLQNRPVLYRSYVRSLIMGRHAGDAYKNLLPTFRWSGIFCMIVNLPPTDCAALNLDEIHSALTQTTQDCGLLLTTREKNEIVVVVSTDEPLAAVVRKRINQYFDDTMLSGHYAADGLWVELSEQNFKTAFDSALDIYRYHFIFPENTRLHYDTIGTKQIKNTGSHLKLFAEIEKDIFSENMVDLRQRLYALTESFKYGNYSMDYCSSTLRDWVTVIYNITQNRHLDVLIVFGYDIRAYYKQIEDIDEFYRWSCDICEILIQNVRQRKKGLDPDLQKHIIELIDKNLENNISLEFLADSLMLRTDVLSRTFKQLMGTSYMDYVKLKKLNRAKELIAEGYSMKDIAMKLGYNSTQYFIKIFKETYGVTPYQYKKNGMPAE